MYNNFFNSDTYDVYVSDFCDGFCFYSVGGWNCCVVYNF